MRNEHDSDSLRSAAADEVDATWTAMPSTPLFLMPAGRAETVRPPAEVPAHARARRRPPPARHAGAAPPMPDARQRPEWTLPYAQRAAADLFDAIRLHRHAAAEAGARALRPVVSALSADGRSAFARWLALQLATGLDAANGGRVLVALAKVDLVLAARVRRQLPALCAELDGRTTVVSGAAVA